MTSGPWATGMVGAALGFVITDIAVEIINKRREKKPDGHDNKPGGNTRF